MTINFFSLKSSELFNKDRMEPNFHFIYKKFDDFQKKQDKKVLELGDKRILLKITDGEHAGQIFVKSGVRFIKNSAVRDFSINFLDGFFISKEKHKLLKRSALKAEDILFTTIGHLGSSAIVKKNLGEANINQNVVKMEINNREIDPYYLTCYLNSSLTKRQLKGLHTRNIHSIITYPKIKSIRIIVANQNFQKKISELYKRVLKLEDDIFSKINRAKEVFYKKLDIDFEKLSDHKHFSKKLSSFKNGMWTPSFSYPKYNDAINLINKKVQTINLGKISKIKKGDETGSENYNDYLDKNTDDVPFIRTSDMINYNIDLYPDFYIPKEIYDELNQDYKKNDVLFSNDGKIGNVAIVSSTHKMVLQSHIRAIRLNNEAKKFNVTPEYLFLVLIIDEIGKFQANKYTVIQSTLPTISNNLENFLIPIIDKKTINDITNLINSSSKLIEKKHFIIEEIKKQFDKYFGL